MKLALLALVVVFFGSTLVQVSDAVAVPSPAKVLYIDWRNINWNNPEQTLLDCVDAGFNVVILAFYLSGSGSADMAKAWEGVSAQVRQQTMQTVHSKGAVVLVSLGGSTDSPFNKPPTLLGKQVADWARNHSLDGVDFDLENFDTGFRAGGMSDTATVKWVADVTNACRAALGSGGIISHAPQGPYFGPVGATNTWAGASGGYSGVYRQAPSIDFFNVQFYNQGAQCYTDYNGLFVTSCSNFPETSVSAISKAGIPMSKIVVGKYVTQSDASNGWVEPATLHQFFTQAGSQLGWHAGVMGWEWGDAGTCRNWIHAIYP